MRRVYVDEAGMGDIGCAEVRFRVCRTVQVLVLYLR
jgi:hypothetical protein